MPPTVFPADFLWGTATAAHQVEGGNAANDWWAWEQVLGHIRDGSRSGLACDQFHRFQQDFALLASLGQRAHRFSVEWSRIEPRPGFVDRAALDHYSEMVDSLRAVGIEPVLTLHHFTNPLWLAQAGGWANPRVVGAFERFTGAVVDALGDRVRYWITINEPTIFASMGYVMGAWPPGRRNPVASQRVLRHMLLAHGRAYHAIHQRRADALVSISHHIRLFDPANPANPLDRVFARARDYLSNLLPLLVLRDGRLYPPLGAGQRIPWLAGTLDYVGVNYYTRELIEATLLSLPLLGKEADRPVPRTPMGWEIYPEGLARAVRLAARFGPVMVTENGVADENDELRPEYLVSHLHALGQAINEGVPVFGYMHWSALDNFEWAEGFSRRFGLVHVDYETQMRTIKPSGRLYATISRTGTVPHAPSTEREGS